MPKVFNTRSRMWLLSFQVRESPCLRDFFYNDFSTLQSFDE